MDEVPLPLKAFLPSNCPTDADVLSEILMSIQSERAKQTRPPSLSLRPRQFKDAAVAKRPNPFRQAAR
jgi:hypothetical protein